MVMMFRLERLLSYRTMSLLGCVLIVSGVLLSAWPLLHNLYIGLGFLLGTGGCVCAITGVLQINRQFTGSNRGLAHGFSLAGNTLGGLLLPGLIAVLTHSYSYSGAMVILAALILNIVPVSLVFSSRVVRTNPDTETSDNNNTEDQATKSIYRNPRLWFCIFSMASTTVGYTNFGLYLPLHLHNTLGLSTGVAASFISVFSVGDLLGRVSGPALSDRLAPRWAWYCGGLAGAGLAMVLVSLATAAVTVGGLTLAAGLCSGVMVGVYPALLADELGPDNLSLTYPLSQTLAGLLNLGGPPLLGLLASLVSTQVVMVVLGASLILGSVPLTVSSLVRCRR